MELIDKEKVIEEIERIKKEDCPTDYYEGRLKMFWFEQFLTFLNTLEVKDMDEEIKNAEDHAYFAGSEAMRVKLIEKACKWLREGGSGWYLTSESGGDEINFVKLAEDFRKEMEDET